MRIAQKGPQICGNLATKSIAKYYSDVAQSGHTGGRRNVLTSNIDLIISRSLDAFFSESSKKLLADPIWIRTLIFGVEGVYADHRHHNQEQGLLDSNGKC